MIIAVAMAVLLQASLRQVMDSSHRGLCRRLTVISRLLDFRRLGLAAGPGCRWPSRIETGL